VRLQRPSLFVMLGPPPLWRPPTAARGPAAATSPAAAASAVASAPAASATATMPTEAARATLVGNAREVPGPSPIPAAAVSGTIPAWLRGALVANGGGDYGGTDHLFDGLASVARLGINEGGSDEQATFAQRMICTQAYEFKQKTRRLAFREFVTAPPPDPPGFVGEARAVLAQLAELVTGKANFTDTASVNLVPVALSQAQVEAFRATGGAGGGGSEPAAAAAAAAATATETTTRPLLLAVSETPGASYLVDPRALDTVSRASPDPAADGERTTASWRGKPETTQRSSSPTAEPHSAHHFDPSTHPSSQTNKRRETTQRAAPPPPLPPSPFVLQTCPFLPISLVRAMAPE